MFYNSSLISTQRLLTMINTVNNLAHIYIRKLGISISARVFFPVILGLLYPCAWGEQINKICQPTRHQDARDDILAFFEVRDALDITWLHAVNSPSKLKEGLTGDIMMLEADVLMRNNLVCQF